MPTTVTVSQRGRIRTSPERKWLRFAATEEYTIDPPGFVWNAALKMAFMTTGRAVDSLDRGRGRMRVRLLGFTTVIDEEGLEVDQGARMRWLNETMWFPVAWASDVISWEPIDDNTARASFVTDGAETAGEFHFDDEGRTVDFRADRYRDTEDGYVLTPWSTPFTGHARFDGVEVPSSGSAVWTLEDGDFEYIEIRVTAVRSSSK